MSLSPKQKKFCREYLVDHNGSQAAIRAGYSPKAAKEQASRLLTNANIKDFIAKLSKPMEMDLAVTAHKVLNQMARRAYVDPLSFFKEIEVNGVLRIVTKFPSELTEDQRMAVDDMKIGEDERPIYRLANKDVSLDKLGKHLKLFTDMDPLVQSFTVMGQVLVDGKPLVFNVGQPAPQFDIKNAPKPKDTPNGH
jgi:phage terminase small subunit